MRLVCGTCSAVQDAPGEASARCGACQALLLRTDSGAPPEARRTRDSSDSWFFRTHEGQAGPFSASQLSELLQQGEIEWTTEVWREGQSRWRPARRDELLVLAVAGARGLGDATTRLDNVHSLLNSESTSEEREHDALEFLEVEPDEDETEGERRAASGLVRAPAPRVLRPPGSSASARVAARDLPTGRLPRDSLPVVARRPSRRTLGIALVAFATGALLAVAPSSFAGPTDEPTAALAPAAMPADKVRAPAAVSPQAEPLLAASPATTKAPLPVSTSLRAAPEPEELRAALRALAPVLRRCVRDPRRGLAVEVAVEGPSGGVRQLDVSSSLTSGELECLGDVFVDFHVPPFAQATMRTKYRYRW